MYVIVNNEKTYELYHYGVLGQKWGIRRYQDASGKLTALGKERYGSDSAKRGKDAYKNAKLAAKSKSQHTKAEKIYNKAAERAYKKQDMNKYIKNKALAIDANRKVSALDAEYKESLKTAQKYGNKRIQNKIMKYGIDSNKLEKKMAFDIYDGLLANAVAYNRNEKYANEILDMR